MIGFIGLILILIVVGGVFGFIQLLTKLFENPETSKYSSLLQMESLNKRVLALEKEVIRLKEILRMYTESNAEKKREDNLEEVVQEVEQTIEEDIVESTKEPEAVVYALDAETEKQVKSRSVMEQPVLESYLTSDLFNKIGAVALIFGVGFFLKYAFDTNLFNPAVQIFLSFLFSGSLIFLASHFYKQEKYVIFSQGIAGAGIGIAYLTIYSGYNSYQLFNYPVTCALMLLTTIIAFQQSIKYNSMATAILGLIGGFLTPYIISNGNYSNPAGLLTYLVFLNGLVIALLAKKNSWKLIGSISVFITYITYFSMHMNNYNAPGEIPSITFLILIWLLYFGFDILKIKNSNYDYDFLNIENTILFYSGVYNLYYQNNNATIIATFLIGFAYLFSGIAVYFKHNKLDEYLKQNFYVFTLLFAIATNLATSSYMKPALFSIEAFMLVYFGTLFEKSYIQKSSMAFFIISYSTLLCNPQTYSLITADNFMPIFNFRDLTFILLIGLTLWGLKVLKQTEKTQDLATFFRYSWTTLLFVFLSVEVNDLMLKVSSYVSSQEIGDLINFNKGMIQVIVWSIYSTKLLSVGLGKNVKPFAVIGSIGNIIAFTALFIHGTTYYPIERYIPIMNLRFITFILSVINLMYISNLLKKYNKESEMQIFLDYAWGTVLFLLVNFEIKDCFINFDNTMQLTLSGGWLIYSILGMYFGIVKRIKSLRYISLFVLGLTILKVFIFDLSFLDQLGRIISFIGLGAILLLLSFLYQKYSEQIKKLINEDIIIENK